MFEYLLIIVLSLVALVVCTISSKHSFFKLKGVPQTKPLFFYGDYKDVFRGKKHNGVVTKEIYDSHKHLPYVGFYILNTPFVLLNDIELIKNVLVKDFSSFSSNNIEPDPADIFISNNPFAASGDKWKELRGYLTPSLTSNKVKAIFSLMEEKSENLVAYLSECGDESPLSGKEISGMFTTDVIAAATMSARVNSFKDPRSTFRQITSAVVIPSLLKSFSLYIPLIYPFFAKFFTYRFITEDQIKATTTLTAEAVASRRKAQSTNYNDFVQQMLSLRAKHSEDVISDKLIASLIWTYIVDGFETSSTVVSYALFELGKHIDIQNRLREEIILSCNENGGKITYDELVNMKYLDMVISECLRLHSPVLAMEKVCTKAYTFDPATPESKPLQMTPGMAVVIPTYALHMDGEFYSRPDEFYPEHFSAEAVAGRPKSSYLPFGDGPRICLGIRLGMAQVKMAIATILKNFEVRTDPASLQDGYSISTDAFLKRPHQDIKIRFLKIK